jgi:hypothetical protein
LPGAFNDELFVVNHRVVSTDIQGPLNRFAGLGQAHFLWMRTHRDDIDESQSGLEYETAATSPEGFTPTIRRGAMSAAADPTSCWAVESHR